MKFKKGEVPDLDFQQAVKRPIPVRCVQIPVAFEIETLEGLMQGKAGDWLIVGIHGEMYPIDDSIFRATYTLLPNSESE